MSFLDVNCDLGEGEPASHTVALMARVDSANIACGGHAGSPASMRQCLELAVRWGVRAGAHPGLPGAADFGRGETRSINAAALRTLLHEQIGPLAQLASEILPAGTLHHVKLHGALYHATEQDAELMDAYLDEVSASWPHLLIYARAGGRVASEARARGMGVWNEAFLDRAYLADGTLVPRSHASAVLSDLESVVGRLRSLCREGGWRAADGPWISIAAETLCVHGDTPGAIRMLDAVKAFRADPRGGG